MQVTNRPYLFAFSAFEIQQLHLENLVVHCDYLGLFEQWRENNGQI